MVMMAGGLGVGIMALDTVQGRVREKGLQWKKQVVWEQQAKVGAGKVRAVDRLTVAE